jgi:hypothetical protein
MERDGGRERREKRMSRVREHTKTTSMRSLPMLLKKALLGVGALVVGLAMAGTASAKGFPPGPGGYGGGGYGGAGVRFGGGHYYRGRHHDHWGGRRWDARYGRHHYWDPCFRRDYYYCPRRSCYGGCPPAVLSR